MVASGGRRRVDARQVLDAKYSFRARLIGVDMTGQNCGRAREGSKLIRGGHWRGGLERGALFKIWACHRPCSAPQREGGAKVGWES
jgi:hypothetical protein